MPGASRWQRRLTRPGGHAAGGEAAALRRPPRVVHVVGVADLDPRRPGRHELAGEHPRRSAAPRDLELDRSDAAPANVSTRALVLAAHRASAGSALESWTSSASSASIVRHSSAASRRGQDVRRHRIDRWRPARAARP